MSVKQVMKYRIKSLRNAALTTHGWRDMLDDGDIDNKCKAPFIFLIQKKSRYLSQALSMLYNDRNKKTESHHMTWAVCCEKTIEKMRAVEDCELDTDDEELDEHNNSKLWVTTCTLM